MTPRIIPLLDERHAAAFLGIAPRTLRNWRPQRRGPRYVKLGSLIRYELTDLLAFVAARKTGETYDVDLDEQPR
jgi:hypothetical protein